jgi:hypothetical protein
MISTTSKFIGHTSQSLANGGDDIAGLCVVTCAIRTAEACARDIREAETARPTLAVLRPHRDIEAVAVPVADTKDIVNARKEATAVPRMRSSSGDG